MFESDEYPFASATIIRTLHFPQPLVTTKIKLDKMMGASGFVFQIEFIGMDQETKARQISLPFEGGNVLKSEANCLWPTNSLLAKRIICKNFFFIRTRLAHIL